MAHNLSPSASDESRSPTPQANGTARLRLLLPINQDPDSCWGWRYALEQHERGLEVEVCLLHVTITKIECCEVNCGTHALPLLHGSSTPEIPLLDQAIATFEQARIPARGFLVWGDRVERILEMAEKLECDEIVLPLNDRPTWSERFWHNNTVRYVQQKERGIHVVTVDENGHVAASVNARQQNG